MKIKIFILFLFLAFNQLIKAQLDINSNVNWEICDNNLDGTETINLTASIPLISSNSSYTYSFFETLVNATQNIFPITNANNYIIFGNKTIYVRVTYPQNNEIEIASLNIILKNCELSLDENQITTSIIIYPNPVNSVLNIKAENANLYEIFDATGKFIINSKINKINVTSLKSGLYFVKVYLKNEIQTIKFIKN